MITIWKRVKLELFLEDWESLPREELMSLGINIKFNTSTWPFVDIEFYDEENKVIKFLRTLEAEQRIKILEILYKKGNKLTTLAPVSLTPLQRTVARIFKIPYRR